MSIKTSLLTIISVVAVASSATFVSSDAEKLDADSSGSLAAMAGTFPAFNQNATASFPLSGAKTPEASFPLLDAESDATALAFLPWLFLLRIKRRLAQQFARKRNHQIPSKRRFGRPVFAGMNPAEHIQQTMRTLAQFLPRLGKSTGICIVSMAMLTMPVDVNAQVQPTPEIILYGTDTVRKHTCDHVVWGISLVVGRGYWRFVSIESHKTYKLSSGDVYKKRHSTEKSILNPWKKTKQCGIFFQQ